MWLMSVSEGVGLGCEKRDDEREVRKEGGEGRSLKSVDSENGRGAWESSCKRWSCGRGGK